MSPQESGSSLRIDLASPIPAYEQLRSQLAGLIETGVLPPGDRLPPVRQLAADLGLAGGTIARAYRELDHAGLVRGHGRHGTVIRPRPTGDDAAQARRAALATAADQLAATARSQNLSDDAAFTALHSALARLPLTHPTTQHV
ncbi:GntR family transcriptional regulator [Allobranchiibius sp. CTAmp26]|nr:GntR family transcriptional regulator [Allobranchiibius sp. CTAmp26]